METPPPQLPLPAFSEKRRDNEMRVWTSLLIPFSLLLLGLGSWLACKRVTACFDKTLLLSLIVIGSLLTLNAFLGFYAVKKDFSFSLTLAHICLTGILMVALLGCIMFGFVVVYSHAENGRVPNIKGQYGGQKDLLASYSSWLTHHISAYEKWGRLRICILGHEYCSQHPIGAFQEACCSKPMCSMNQQGCPQSCYDCDTCQAAILQDVENAWTITTVVLLGDWVALMMIFVNQCRIFAHRGVYLRIRRSLSTRSWR